MDQFDRTVTNTLSMVDNNPYLSSGLSLFLVLYAGLAAPQLPESVAVLFDNTLFKFVIMFLVAYSAKKNPTVALVAAIGLMVSLNTLTKFKVNRQLLSMIYAQEAEVPHPAQDAPVVPMMDVDSIIEENDGVPEGALAELQAEEGSAIEESMEPPAGPGPGPTDGGSATCSKKANFRNSFYPQYVNMKSDAYDARYTGEDVGGFDASSAYASI
jgi:hypothetical protein